MLALVYEWSRKMSIYSNRQLKPKIGVLLGRRVPIGDGQAARTSSVPVPVRRGLDEETGEALTLARGGGKGRLVL
jgi:hypothetical protein